MSTEKVLEPKASELSWTLMCVSVASGTMSIQYGYYLWIVYSPTVIVQDFYNLTIAESLNDPNANMFFMGVTIALFPLGGIFGAIAVGCLMDRLGRKCTLMITNILSVASAVSMSASNVIQTYEFIMFTRLYTGICIGILAGAVPIYLGEISPRRLRGSIVMIFHFFLSIGVLLAQILALREILGTKKGWGIIMGVIAVVPAIQIFLVPFYPESPRYLMIQKRDEENARKVLQLLRGRDNVESEMEELRQEDISEKSEKQMNSLKLLSNQSLRGNVIMVIVLMTGQQLIGANAAYYYTERILMTMKVEVDKIRYISIGTTLLIIATVVLALFTMDSVGRRPLLLIGFGICTITSLLLIITLRLQADFPVMTYFSTVFVDIYFTGYALAPSPIPSILTIELFSQSSRASAFVIAGFVQWLLNFLTGVTFLQLETRIGSFSFLIFCPICAAVFVYIFKFVPETKKMTFLDIRRAMAIRTARKVQVKSNK
ncbi:solute carrier family 2, facilitated glucose transporter member 5-like [Elgaria multicarinata webbii]|uniref:solute carrier family 2, facilitated glucose transporter member 5-like n=1 Tax=Elgaria multicarinata webbii TaxID=159646 RepID=UPI002FCD01D1